MTVRLLAEYGDAPVGAVLALGSVTEAALIAQNQAVDTSDAANWPLVVTPQYRELQPNELAATRALVSDYEDASNPKFARPYTWATLPAPADYIGPAYISDIGLHGSMWRSDGSTWGLVDGQCILEASAVAKAAVTGSTTEALVHTYAMPAGLLGLNGELEVFCKFTQAGSAATRTVRVRLGGVSGSQALNTTTTAANLSVPVVARVQNRGSASAQLCSNGTLAGVTGSNSAWSTFTADTSAAVDVAITVQLGNAADSITLEAWQITLRRP